MLDVKSASLLGIISRYTSRSRVLTGCGVPGVLHWQLDADKHENDPELEKIRADRGYSYQVRSMIDADRCRNTFLKLRCRNCCHHPPATAANSVECRTRNLPWYFSPLPLGRYGTVHLVKRCEVGHVEPRVYEAHTFSRRSRRGSTPYPSLPYPTLECKSTTVSHDCHVLNQNTGGSLRHVFHLSRPCSRWNSQLSET